MQFNVRNFLGTFLPVHPAYSWVSEHVNFMEALEELNGPGMCFIFLRVKIIWVNEWNTNVLGIRGNSVL